MTPTPFAPWQPWLRTLLMAGCLAGSALAQAAPDEGDPGSGR